VNYVALFFAAVALCWGVKAGRRWWRRRRMQRRIDDAVDRMFVNREWTRWADEHLNRDWRH
jgi:hypothetical protein